MIHHPGGAGGAFTSAGTTIQAVEFIDNGLDQGLLYMVGRWFGEFGDTGGSGQANGFCAKGRKGEFSLCAKNLRFVEALVGIEAPDTCAIDAGGKDKAAGDYIFGAIIAALVAGLTLHLGDRP